MANSTTQPEDMDTFNEAAELTNGFETMPTCRFQSNAGAIFPKTILRLV